MTRLSEPQRHRHEMRRSGMCDGKLTTPNRVSEFEQELRGKAL